jgi:hypothetical protein
MEFINTIKKISKITNFATTIDYVTLKFIPGLFLVCGLVMTYNQCTKSPIVCYGSVSTSGNGLPAFLENSCYLAKRYYNHLSEGQMEPLQHENIYLWFSIILLLQTASLCLPKIFWIFLGKRNDLCYLLKLCYDLNTQNSIEKLLARMEKFLHVKRRHWNCNFLVGYLLTKFFLLAICSANFLFIYYKIFLQNILYPISIIKELVLCNTTATPPNSMFQQVVFCKVPVYHIGSENNLILQCLLTWNYYYEKIFAFITCLLIIAMFLTFLDLFKWSFYYLFKQRVLTQYLNRSLSSMMVKTVENVGGDFSNLMSVDLYFIILMISFNINDIIASEVVFAIYLSCKRNGDGEIELDSIV